MQYNTTTNYNIHKYLHLSKTVLIITEHYSLHEGRICCIAVVLDSISFSKVDITDLMLQK